MCVFFPPPKKENQPDKRITYILSRHPHNYGHQFDNAAIPVPLHAREINKEALVEALEYKPIRLGAGLGRMRCHEVGVQPFDIALVALVALVVRGACGKDTAVDLGSKERAKGGDLAEDFALPLNTQIPSPSCIFAKMPF